MLNRYTVDVYQEGTEIKARITVGDTVLGTVWAHKSKATNKDRYNLLFESVSRIIYGQETKEEQKEKSYCKVLKAIEAKSKREQEALQEEE